MVISVFPDYGQAIDRYRSVRGERLERQAQQAQQQVFNRMLQGIEDPQQRAALETMGPQQGAAAFVNMRQQQEAARAEAERERRAQINEYGNNVATRFRAMQGQEGFDPEAFLSQAYAYGQSQYGMQMKPDQFAQLVSNPMAGELPERGFETVTVDGRQMQVGPDGRYYNMPGATSGLERGLTALAGSIAAGEGSIRQEVPQADAEALYGPGARAEYYRDRQGNVRTRQTFDPQEQAESEIGVDRASTDLQLARQRLADLERQAAAAQDEETRARINQDMDEARFDLDQEQGLIRIQQMQQELDTSANAEVRARIDQDMAEERHDLEMARLQQQIDSAQSAARRAELEADREAVQAEFEAQQQGREREQETRQERARRYTDQAMFRPLKRGLEGAIEIAIANSSAIGGREDQLAAWINPQSTSGRFASFMRPVRAEAAFGRLQDMRDNSPTGGALGQVSNIELGLLEDSRGAMSLDNAPDIVADNAIEFYDASFYAAHGRPEQVADLRRRNVISESVYQDYLVAEQQHRSVINDYRRQYESRFIEGRDPSRSAQRQPEITVDAQGNQQ